MADDLGTAHENSTPEQKQAFAEAFGVTEDDLTAQGVDIRQYIHEHASEWIDRTYEASQAKMAAGESLLPYEARTAWIAKGPSKLSRSWTGTVTIDSSAVQLQADGQVLATSPPAQIRLHGVLIWFGMGLRLDMQDGAKWYVQPRYSPTRMSRAEMANVVFRAALIEAGAR